jgi:Domain of unknown function (DUF932)
MLNFLSKRPSERSNFTADSRFSTISLEEASFPIAHKELFYYQGQVAKPIAHKALIRTDTQAVLYVGKEYKPVTNAEVYVALSELEQQQWQLDSIKATGSTVFQFNMINPTITFAINGFETKGRLTVINSYDGSHALKIHVGGFLVVCGNGLILGGATTFRRKHTSGIGDFSHQLVKAKTESLKEAIAKAEAKVWNNDDVDKLAQLWKSMTKSYHNKTNGQPNDFVIAINQQLQIEQQRGYVGEFAMLMAATDVITHQAAQFSPSYILQLEHDIPKLFFN